MKTILVPTDFSDNASNAVYYAAALASQTRSKIILMHAIALEVIEIPGNPFKLKPDPRLEDYYLDKLNSLAKQIRSSYSSSLKVETICIHGSLIDQLNDLVRSKGAALMVMGTKGAHNLVQKLIGTHTASIIKQAICPVLIIPVSTRFQGLKNIAYASDFERQDIGYLKQLLNFAEPLGSAICIFNVKSEEQLDLVSDQKIIGNIKKHFSDKKFSFAQLKENDVIAGIQDFIKENNMDLLAVSVHKPDILEKIFHTSVSQGLAFQTTVPLLALPEKPYSTIKTNHSRQPKSLRTH